MSDRAHIAVRQSLADVFRIFESLRRECPGAYDHIRRMATMHHDDDAAEAETLLDDSVNEIAVMLNAVEQSAGSQVSQAESKHDGVAPFAIKMWAFMNEHFDQCFMAAYGVAARDDDPCDCTSSANRKVRDLAIDMLIGDALPAYYIKDDGRWQ